MWPDATIQVRDTTSETFWQGPGRNSRVVSGSGLHFTRRGAALPHRGHPGSGVRRPQKRQPEAPDGAVFMLEKHSSVFAIVRHKIWNQRDGPVPALHVVRLF